MNSVMTSTPVEHGEKRRFDSWPSQINMEDWQSGRMQEFAKLQVAEMLPIGSNPISSAKRHDKISGRER